MVTTISLKENQKYFFWADSIRVVAICLVVLIHSFHITPVSSWSTALTLALFSAAKVAVPLFVMLSGALLLPKQDSWFEFFQKRWKRVGIPWLFWTITFTLILFLLGHFSVTSFPREMFKNFSALFSFLPMIACLYAVLPLYRIFISKAQGFEIWYLIAIWFVAVCLLPYLRNSLAFPLFVDNGLVRQTIEYSGYLVLGYQLTRPHFRQPPIRAFGAIGVITFLILFFFLTRNSTLNLVYLNYTSPFIVILSVDVFLSLIAVSEKFFSQLLTSKMQLLSQASFGVFLIHSFLLQYILQFDNWLKLPNILWENLVRWGVTLVLSFSVILILHKTPKIGKVLFG
jgi:surface polysaccharide O-acyltransferase-like enzyme